EGGKIINVYLHDEMKKIIEQWGNPSKAPDDYVFPVLTKGTSLLKQEADKWRYKRVSNNMLTKIGKELGFNVHLCINLARHSFATTLKLNGTPVSFISEALGHSNSITTTHYLKSLPDENVKQLSSSLLNFG
ncbi:MAG: tyrosine-type recombinase/integrase, partial [Bacteroidia bacterium]|nr:tyrosine-type recombinase/integrase [Bacteroidia bacterium]